MGETTLSVDARALTDQERKRLATLLTRAQKGDRKALEEVRPLMATDEMWAAVGDLGRIARDTWIEATATNNALVREGCRRSGKVALPLV